MYARNLLMLITILALVFLSACTAIGIQTDGQRIATACAGASASIDVLTVANSLGKLDAQQQAAILTAIGVVAPICAAEVAPTLDDVKREAFLAAITGLQLAAAKVTEVKP